MANEIKPSAGLNDVPYEIRLQLAQRAHDMERGGSEVTQGVLRNSRAE
jgi:hypothetical protein